MLVSTAPVPVLVPAGTLILNLHFPGLSTCPFRAALAKPPQKTQLETISHVGDVSSTATSALGVGLCTVPCSSRILCDSYNKEYDSFLKPRLKKAINHVPVCRLRNGKMSLACLHVWQKLLFVQWYLDSAICGKIHWDLINLHLCLRPKLLQALGGWHCPKALI